MSIVDLIKKAVDLDNVIFKKYALTRMLERNIISNEIQKVLKSFVIVEEYYDDKPLPSFLILGYTSARPLHMVISYDNEFDKVFIITIYEPSIELWSDDYLIRRKNL